MCRKSLGVSPLSNIDITIAGLEDIDGGELYIDGVLSNRVPPALRNISMIFQSYALYPHMTVYQNIAFPLRVKREKRQDIDITVRKTAKLLDLDKELNKKPAALSGGQKQRVAIGRALVRNPKVLLMDEPFSSLDAQLRGQLRAELKRLHKTLETTIVFVTHDQEEALTIADRVAVMNEGSIQQIGTPQEIYNNPVNTFVAGFVGQPSMNFIPAEIRSVDNRYVCCNGVFNIKPRKDIIERIKQGKVDCQEVIIGIRPEDLRLTERQDGAFGCRIDDIEIMGINTLLSLKTETGVKLISSISDKKLNDSLQAGQFRWVSVDSEMCCFFDRRTGKRL